MKQPDSILFYVEKPRKAAEFYKQVFNAQLVEASDNFAMIVFSSGLALGLWAYHDVKPKPIIGVAGTELLITMENREQVETAKMEILQLGGKIIEEPETLDFGYTWLAEAPDGHFLRAFHPE